MIVRKRRHGAKCRIKASAIFNVDVYGTRALLNIKRTADAFARTVAGRKCFKGIIRIGVRWRYVAACHYGMGPSLCRNSDIVSVVRVAINDFEAGISYGGAGVIIGSQ